MSSTRGREQLQAAGKACAVGVAVEKLEAWLLADEKALRLVLDDETIQRQPDPESLTSRDEHSDNNPKRRLSGIMEQAAGESVPSAEVPERYAAIAALTDLTVLEERCPQGFAPFAGQVRDLVRPQAG